MLNNLDAEQLESTVKVLCKEVNEKQRDVDWHTNDEDSLWFELVACLLSSQVQYENSCAAASYLRSHGLLNLKPLQQDINVLEIKIREALEQPIFPPPTKSGGRKYRFPKLRAHHICRTVEAIYLNDRSIKEILKFSNDEFDARQIIMQFSLGIGPKQASLFLRNIGYTQNLAILDSHVLQYMTAIGLLQQSFQRITSLRQYEQVERKLLSYAQEVGENMVNLDIAIWIVMRIC